jgi:hypothetical protein
MSATTVETPQTEVRPEAGAPAARTVRLRQAPSRPVRVRPAGRSGRGLAPRSRPAGPVAPPSLRTDGQPRVRACVGEPATVPQLPTSAPVRTRLTDRGIAVILVAGAMIVLAAVTVVTLTALRVTSDSSVPLASSVVLPL